MLAKALFFSGRKAILGLLAKPIRHQENNGGKRVGN